mmetsp:Transcript_11363/g.28246  ORF Transcript_11363/g.28246 Transcript_11363/m.28246 type:complete len:417 (+) Transcript_11363:1275-2525(+)
MNPENAAGTWGNGSLKVQSIKPMLQAVFPYPMASASTPPFTPAYSQRRQPSKRQCGASGQGEVSRISATKGSRRRRSCDTIQPRERSCSRLSGHSTKCGGCVCAASSTLLRIENSPTAVAATGRTDPSPCWSGFVAEEFSTRQLNRAAGSAVPRRSMRSKSTPGRSSTLRAFCPGCNCTSQGSSSASRANSASVASALTLSGGCHSEAARGTCKSRPGGRGSKTECSCLREAKKQRVPRASLRPEKSSHSPGGSCPTMALPDGSSGADATSKGSASDGLPSAAGPAKISCARSPPSSSSPPPEDSSPPAGPCRSAAASPSSEAAEEARSAGEAARKCRFLGLCPPLVSIAATGANGGTKWSPQMSKVSGKIWRRIFVSLPPSNWYKVTTLMSLLFAAVSLLRQWTKAWLTSFTKSP